MTLIQEPHDPLARARRGARRASTSRASSRRRSPASARARSSAGGSSATRGRWSRSIVLDPASSLLATTSIGWGPIAGLVEVRLQHRRPAEPGPGADDVAAADVARRRRHPVRRPPVRARQREGPRHVRPDDARRAEDARRHPRRSAVLAVTIGVLVGAIAGYFGRWIDSALMRFTDVILVIPLLLIAAVAGFALGATRRVERGARARTVPVDRAGPARAGRVPGPARAGVRRRGPGGRRVATGGSSSSTSCPTPSARSSSRTTLLMGAGILTEAALGFLGFGIQRPDVSLGSLVSDYEGAFSQPAVAVHLARRVHRRHRAVPAVHRRRPARRVRPPPEADPQAQGPRARSRESTATARLGPSRTSRVDAARRCQTTSATTASTTSTAPAAIVPTCHVTGARSCSSRGSSR